MDYQSIGPAPLPPQPIPTQKSRFWAVPCTKVFAVKGLLYQIDISKLAKASEYFKGLHDLDSTKKEKEQAAGDGGARTQKGLDGTIENPIFLEDISTSKWESFLRYCDHEPWDPSGAAMTQANYVDLLYLGDKFIMPKAISFAIAGLTALKISPFDRLGLGLRFGIMPWIAPACREILRRHSVLQTSFVDTIQLTGDMILFIAKAEVAIEHERRFIAYFPPTFKQGADDAPYCPSHNHCLKALSDTWRKVVAPRLIHPTTPLPLQQAEGFLSTVAFDGMASQCRTYLKEMVRQRKAFTRGYDAIEQKLIKDMKDMMYHLPLVEEEEEMEDDQMEG